MLSFQNKNIFGESRLIFLSEIPSISRGDVASVEAKKEKKVEEKRDAEDKVTREGREAATWSVDSLVSGTNATIAKKRSALAELPQSFNNRFRSEIAKYIRNSPDRFESDEYRGLSNAEFNRFSNDVRAETQRLVDQYAPTEKEIEAKQKATLNAEEAVKLGKESHDKMSQQAESLEKSVLDKISDDPGPIPDLPTLAQKMGEYQSWNAEMQKASGAISGQVSDFQRGFSDFAQARNGLRSYKKFIDYFSSGDPERQDFEARKGSIERKLDATIKKLQAGQSKLEKYGEKMSKASNEQKAEKLKERDQYLKQLEENKSLSKEEKAERKARYEKLKDSRDALQTRRDEMQKYKDEVVVTQKENIEDKMEYAEARQDDMGTYGVIVRASIEELDRLLEDPDIPEVHKEALRKTRDQMAKKEDAIDLTQVGIQATLSENFNQWNALSEEEQSLAQQTYSIDTHLTQDIDPALLGLDGQIGILDKSMLQYTESKEDIMKHYDEVFKIYDGVDKAVDTSVLQYSLANEKLIGSLESQKDALGKMSMDVPSGVSGFFEATLGAGLSTAGAGITEFGHFVGEQSKALDEIIRYTTEDMNPAFYYIAKVQTLGLDFAIGTGAGLLEMGGGLVTMVGKPTETVKGLGALIGRNPATGEWFDGTTGNTWSEMVSAIFQVEHFKKGQIGYAFGRMFPDVALALTGAGAGVKGVQAAKVAYTAAREAGEATMEAIRIAAVKGGQTVGTEVIASAKETYEAAKALPGAIKKAPGKVLEYAKEKLRRGAKEAEETVPAVVKAEEPAGAAATQGEAAATKVERRGTVYEKPKLARTEELPKKPTPNAGESLATNIDNPEEAAAAALRGHEERSASKRVNELAQENFGRAIEEIASGKSPLTPEIFDEMIRSEFYIPNLRKMLSEGKTVLDTRLEDVSSLLRRIDEAEVIHVDLRTVAQSFEHLTLEAKVSKLDEALSAVASGEKLPAGDDLAASLERFRARDPETFNILRNTDPKTVMESQCLEAIIGGHKIEAIGSNGPIRVYIGSKHLGKGGLGSVDEALYVRAGETHFRKGAYKRAHDTETARAVLDIERAAAKEVADWNHPNLIRAEEIGEDFIIYETGSEASSLKGAFDAVPADEWFTSFGESIEGMEEMWRRGTFHGDYKAENVLTYIEDGKKVTKVIDISPVEFKRITGPQNWGRTPDYFFETRELDRAAGKLRKTGKLSVPEMRAWLGRAQDVKAIGKTLERAMGQYIKDTPEAMRSMTADQKALIGRMKRFIELSQDAFTAGHPQLMKEFRTLISDLNEEFRLAKENQARPSIGYRGLRSESAVRSEEFGATVDVGPKKPPAEAGAPAQDPFADWGDL